MLRSLVLLIMLSVFSSQKIPIARGNGFLGCFSAATNWNYFGNWPYFFETSITVAKCILHCRTRGAIYAGISGQICQCAFEMQSSTLLPYILASSSCVNCPGSKYETCGNTISGALSVYVAGNFFTVLFLLKDNAQPTD